ncbi:LOW QUALITY PROTEIN: hypothetical protein BDA96_08G180100 [Sorghum bicolor]|uniref:Uncharacterized protein n=2 Tax=Sorghum bicolor TaxID=4558 RepID=A0A921QGX4_SORBI|nr:LOW QUALITY PROTEIN: hypothetical protein BDA96_08G180100 [Sorghum bicolor]KXG23954.1 LOW QUALITY PROTEIN: hypothetical protein SORBI_3008G163600 [Sorghum bicolor]
MGHGLGYKRHRSRCRRPPCSTTPTTPCQETSLLQLQQPAMDHQRRGRCRQLAALVAAALCLVAAHEGRCGAAARHLHAVEEAVLDVAPAEAPEAAARWAGGGDDAALGEAKWLPMSMPVPVQVPAAASALASGLRFPPVVFPLGGASMPWLPVPGAQHAFAGPGGGGGGGIPALVPPYVGATRQEQLSLWASLFNPLQVRPRLPPISLGGGGDTTAGPGVERAGVPAIASAGKAAEGEVTVDVPTAGAGAEPKWGVFLGNIDHRN